MHTVPAGLGSSLAWHGKPHDRGMPITVFQGKLRKGEEIGGRYRILRKLGEGGAGSVYHCRDRRKDVEVAVKVLDNPSDIGRFKREGRVMKAVQNAHVLRLLGSGNHEGQVPYLVLEYMDGGSLRQYLDRKKRLPPEEAAWILMQAIRGLRAAKTVHRDLKPENLLVQIPEGQRGVRFIPGDYETGATIKVADFGLAKAADGTNETSLTRSAAIMGTPTYMSPEQCRSTKNVSFKTDIYAIGCILIEMVSGTPPYDAKNVYDIMAMHCDENEKPSMGRIPKQIKAIAQTCLEKSPGKRYRSLKALEDDLAAVAGVRSESAGAGGWWIFLLVLLLLAGATAAGWYWFEDLQKYLPINSP